MGVIRQGDVLLVRVKAIPKDAVRQQIKGTKLILAYGEATGHHHRFEFRNTDHDIKLYHCGTGARYLDVAVPSDLLHEEHSTARIPAGFWMAPVQVEYTPAELRRVAD